MRFFTFVLLLCSFSAFASGDKRPDAGLLILQSFQSSCDAVGSWTDAAMTEGKNLTSILQQLLATDACKPYANQIQKIDSLAVEVARNSSTSTSRAVHIQDDLIAQLSITLKTTTDASSLATLQGALVSAERARASAIITASHEQSDRDWNQVANLSSFLNQLVQPNSSPTLGDCLRQSPTAAVQIGNNLLAYAGGFISPVVGATSAVIGQLVNVGIQALRDAKYSRSKWNIEKDQMPTALRCGLESMSEYYCKTDDATQILDLSKSYTAGNTTLPLFNGVDIASRYLPSFSNWLAKVQGGVSAQDSYQADKKNAIRAKKEYLIESTETVSSNINAAVDSYRFSAGSDFSLRQGPFLSAVSAIATKLVTPSVSSSGGSFSTSASVTQVFQPSQFYWACWLVQGYKDGNTSSCPPPPNSTSVFVGGDPVVTYLKTYFLKDEAALDALATSINKNWADAAAQVQKQVELEFSRIVQTNADSVLTMMGEAGLNGANSPSVVATLNKTYDFLDRLKKQPATIANSNLVTEISNRMLQITNALAVYNNAPGAVVYITNSIKQETICDPKLTQEECTSERLQKMARIFRLNDGLQGFVSSVKNLIEVDLIHRLNANEFPVEKTQILKALGTEINLTLSVSGLKDKTSLYSDLNTAQAITGDNLKNFRDFYVDAFRDAVKREAEKTQGEVQSGPHRPHGSILGALCTQWLLTSRIPLSKPETFSDWPDATTADICRGASIYSANDAPDQNGQYKPSIQVGELEQSLKAESFSGKRACVYHNFRRSEALSRLPDISTP